MQNTIQAGQIGFIGQGWIGRHYADDFENRGYDVVRYALEEPYNQNKEKIAACDIVFVAVPTPTTPEGFDDSCVREVLSCVAPGATAVVKSTLLPGTTEKLQETYPALFVLHSPEFLVERTAADDAARPRRNLIGIPEASRAFRDRADAVLSVLPEAPYTAVMTAREAELVKHDGNCFLYTKVLFVNMLHDLITHSGADWQTVRDAFVADPRIGESHTEPVHQTGRGAGGHCFIKDFEAFRRLYAETVGDPKGQAVLDALMEKNAALLMETTKDLDLLEGVYGDLSRFSEMIE